MNPFSAFVLFAMIWAMVFLIALQVGQDTQGDRGARLIGTHASSPEVFRMRARLLWSTVVAVAIWGAMVWVIVSGIFGIDDLRRLTGFRPRG